MSLKQELMAWVLVVISCGLAVLMPTTVWRRLRRPEAMREAWLYSRPGYVITGCVTVIIVLLGSGLLMAFLAVVYWLMWATVVLIFGALVAISWYLIRYLMFDPRTVVDLSAESDDDAPPA